MDWLPSWLVEWAPVISIGLGLLALVIALIALGRSRRASPKAGPVVRELGALIGSRLWVLLNVVVDAGFLVLWLVVLALFDEVTANLQNKGHLDWMAAKVILGVATLLLIILFLYWDLRHMNVQQRRRYEEERRRMEEDRGQLEEDREAEEEGTKVAGAPPSVSGGDKHDEHADQPG
jgi:hypothetical protein